jgi:hypothetical protein
MGLVTLAERKTPPGANPAAHFERRPCESGFHGIDALPILAFGGRDGQPHLFAQRSADESAQRMRLPPSHFEQFLGSRPVRTLQQVEDRRGFAAFPDVVFCAPGAFFFVVACFPALPPTGATLARRAPAAAFLVGLVSIAVAAGAVSVRAVVDFMFSPWAVITA